MTTIRGWVRLQALVIVSVILCPGLVLGQAAVEYGMSASHSTAMTSRALSSVGSRFQSALSVGKLTPLRVPPPPTKNLQMVMHENRQKLEAQSQTGGGVVHIESLPAKAAISVDGRLVGSAPTDLKLPAGKHLIELTQPGYEPWRIEVSANPQESTSVTAQLESRYRSSITLSFDQ